MNDILTVKNLHKSFGSLKVIDELSFTVEKGSVFGFVGANGAGKTTTMRMVLGLLPIDSGEITICGERVVYGKTAKSVGYLPDVPEFYNYMRPMEYLNLCAEVSGMPKAKTKTRGKELLNLVGLSKVNRKIGGFSRGMKQRLGLAQALLSEPALLICDEPTSALDPIGRKDVLDIIAAVKGETTVIFSTHILSDVERVCDKAAVLHNGRIALAGTLSQMRKRRNDIYKASFPDSEQAKRFAASIGVEPAEDGKTVIAKAACEKQIEALFKNGLTPISFELLEPTLEDLYLEAVK